MQCGGGMGGGGGERERETSVRGFIVVFLGRNGQGKVNQQIKFTAGLFD